MNISRLVSLISVLIPINFYIIAGGNGWGLHFPFFRVQDTVFGLNALFFWQEVSLVLDGHISGRTALSILLWTGGAFLLVVSAILFISRRGSHRGRVGVYGFGCALFVISTMVQYGPLFDGPAGTAIPIGLPLLIFIGYLLWIRPFGEDWGEESDDDFSKEENLPSMTLPDTPVGDDASGGD